MRAAHLEAQEGHGRRRAHHGVQQRHAPLRVHADAVLVVQPQRLGRRRQDERVLQERELFTCNPVYVFSLRNRSAGISCIKSLENKLLNFILVNFKTSILIELDC